MEGKSDLSVRWKIESPKIVVGGGGGKAHYCNCFNLLIYSLYRQSQGEKVEGEREREGVSQF